MPPMFSYLLNGKLGEFMAPRPCSSQEIWALLKSGLFDKVLSELRKSGNQIDINALDTTSGMAMIHYVCAGGAMELLVELLSQHVDLSIPSIDGNNALHFAALNSRKGIVEILLRSGADPSVPNHEGLLPIELATSAEVTELFLRDRTNIFSPIATVAQSRILVSDYIKQQDASLSLERLSLNESNSSSSPKISTQFGSPQRDPINLQISSTQTNYSNSKQSVTSEDSGAGSGKMPVFNMNSEFEDETANTLPALANPSHQFKGEFSDSHKHTIVGVSTPMIKPPRHIAQHSSSSIDTFSDSASLSDEPGNYTIVGVTSMPRGPMHNNNVSSNNNAHKFNGSHALLSADSQECDEDYNDEDDYSPHLETNDQEPTPRSKLLMNAIPKLNFNQLAPPPIDAHSTVSTYSLSARNISTNGPFPTHTNNSSNNLTGSTPVSNVGPPPTAMNPILSARRGAADPISARRHSGEFTATRRGSGSSGTSGHSIELLVSVPPLQHLHAESQVSGGLLHQQSNPQHISPVQSNMNFYNTSSTNASVNHTTPAGFGNRNDQQIEQQTNYVSFSEYNSNNNRNSSLRYRQQQLSLMSTSHSQRKTAASQQYSQTPFSVASHYSYTTAITGDLSPRHDSALKDTSYRDISFSSPNTTQYTPQGMYEFDLQQDQEELSRAVMVAATETAMGLQSSRDDFENRRLTIRNCQKLNAAGLRKLLTFDPSLSMCRATEQASLAVDGQTPLHVAAFFGNIDALKILFEMGSENTTAWVRDLQGRTPLHIAAAQGKKECCEYLREQMRLERANRDPVGVHAPVDLAGTTPLGWAAFGSKGKPKSGVETSLFKAGDRSILPQTPYSLRAGKSPWKTALLNSSLANFTSRSNFQSVTSSQFNTAQNTAVKPPRDNSPAHSTIQQIESNLIFAFSEANGWTPMMEDRVLICCPVVDHSSWSLFGVFDGHGGSFCSSYLAANIPQFFSHETTEILQAMDGEDNDISAAQLSQLLTNVCVKVDKELSLQPRMLVEKSTSTGKISCMDSSGSTAVMLLITPKYIAVSNVGDSRAVLAQRTKSDDFITFGSSSRGNSAPSSPTHATRKQFFDASIHSPEGVKTVFSTVSQQEDIKNEEVNRAESPPPQQRKVTTPVTATPAPYSLESSNQNLDYLTASIERLNPNMSTPTTATPHHNNSYNHTSAFTPSQYAQFQHSEGSPDVALTAVNGFLTVNLTNDHKAYLPEERARAEAAGAIVEQVPNSSAYQISVRGSDVKLRMSRSFGDFYLKQNETLNADRQAVIAVPEVMVLDRDERDAFVVLACDGIFDVMTNQEVVTFIAQQIGYNAAGRAMSAVTTSMAAEACDALLAECLTRGTVDNISVILVIFGVSASRSVDAYTGGGGVQSSNPYQYYNTNTGMTPGQNHIAVQRSSESMAFSGSASQLHHHPPRSPRDYSVDIPINSGSSTSHHNHNSLLSGAGSNIQNTSHNLHTRAVMNGGHGHSSGSLNNVFGNVDEIQAVSSPLNTMAGSSRGVRKQLQFHDS